MNFHVEPISGMNFFFPRTFLAAEFKSRVRRKGPRYAGKPRRLGPAKSARERMAKGQGGVGSMGVPGRPGTQGHAFEP